MPAKTDHIDNDPFASRRQPQQGERAQSERRPERGSAHELPRERRGTPARPDAPQQRAPKDPADELMQGGD